MTTEINVLKTKLAVTLARLHELGFTLAAGGTTDAPAAEALLTGVWDVVDMSPVAKNQWREAKALGGPRMQNLLGRVEEEFGAPTIDPGKLGSFEHAFFSGGGPDIADCVCGRTFYYEDNPDLDREKMEADHNAEALAHHVAIGVIEGYAYAADCTCWHPLAKGIIHLLDSHMPEIARYYRAEKERRQKEVDQIPDIEN